MNYVLPVLLAATLVYAAVKKVNAYNAFVDGAKQSVSLTVSVLPYLAAMFVLVNLLRQSGLSDYLVRFLSPPFKLLGIPSELVELTLLRPFSGSGSIALLTEIYKQYGTDSYVARCASVMMGSTETVFYVSAVYFANTKIKKTVFALPIALFCTLVGCVVTCALCKVM
ncbi:MAG: spore maturation protein [Corallococcus sp.]|nr:spore maturation protein [Corallococcus sp.]